MANQPVVLFLSTHNEARSQMAEAVLRKYAGDRFDIYSAGLDAGEFSPLTKQVLDEAGVSYAGQTAKSVIPLLGKLDVRFLITVSHSTSEKGPTVFPGALYYFSWDDLSDPDTASDDTDKLGLYRALYTRIDAHIQEWLTNLDVVTDARLKRSTDEMKQAALK